MQIIESLVAAGRLDDAVDRLTQLIEVHGDADGELHFRRGRLEWRMNRRAAATTDYATAVELNPFHRAASMALTQARDIEAFFNPDLYNP